MSATASNHLISDLSDYVGTMMGMSFPPEKWGELEKRISGAASALGFSNAASCIQWILSSPADRRRLDMLVNCLTVGETFFFRDSGGLHKVRDHAFPAIMRAHAHGDRRVRIWCAGCSTGEEPYSLAMVASEYPGLRGWDVSILATDINRVFLKKAEAGVYTAWSFRGVLPGTREKFFYKGNASTWEVLPAIRSMVTFAPLNLIDDVYPALVNNTNAIDLILCRNVLMYFTPDLAQKVISRLHRSLLPEGWLLVSPVEAPLLNHALFATLPGAGAVLHRKASTGRAALCLPAPRTPPVPRRRLAPAAEHHIPAATYQRAMERYADADYDGAIDILTMCASRPPVEAAVFQLLARACANKGMLTKAEGWCTLAIAADTMDAASRYLLAMVRIEQLRPDEAISDLVKAIYLEPDFVVAHYTLANLYRRKGKKRESDRHLGNALAVLRRIPSEQELPESEGMAAGKLVELIAAARMEGGANGRRHIDG